MDPRYGPPCFFLFLFLLLVLTEVQTVEPEVDENPS
jgi:hypothetical protein